MPKPPQEMQDALQVTFCSDQTFVVVVAIHQDEKRNFVKRLCCKKGLPIGGYCFDSKSDCYHIECADYLPLGYVPASYKASMAGDDVWRMRIPMTEGVLRKYMSSMQKRELKHFCKTFQSDEYKIQYIQMIDPN
jgi:hypothetical protein